MTPKLLLVSLGAAFGCVGDGCILTATSTALAFRWSALRAGLTIGLAHLFYESLGLLLSTSGALRGEKVGSIIAIVGALGLFFCIRKHSLHIHHEHDDGSECHHHDHHDATAPIAALSILFITSADAFFAGVSIPAGFEDLPRYSLFLSALITASVVGTITGGFLSFAKRKEAGLSSLSRVKFRKASLMVAYCFVTWLFLASAIDLIRG
jgi:hypothetical protein